jgi:hypothetical protein
MFIVVFAPLGFRASEVGSLLPTFREDLSVSSLKVGQFKENLLFNCMSLEDGIDTSS